MSPTPSRALIRRVLRGLLLLLALSGAGWLAAGCVGGPQTVWTEPPASEAEAAYREALEAMESGQYIEAAKRFNALRVKYPFSSRWTNLAELRLADIYLSQARYGAAAEAYSEFVKAHPTHEDVPYALYKIGAAYYAQMPSDFFVLPDPWQRELNSALQADAALARFLKRYPESQHAAEAAVMHEEVRNRLARHELYAAEFYLERDAVVGASNRLLFLVQNYPDAPEVTDDALFLLARTYILQNDPVAAAGALTRLLESFPQSEWTADATVWLERHALRDTEPMSIGAPPKATN